MKLQEYFKTAEQWTKGAMWRLRSEKGSSTSCTRAEANCFCLLGAVEAFCSDEERLIVVSKLGSVIRDRFHSHLPLFMGQNSHYNAITEFNDSTKTEFEHIRSVIVEAGV